MGDGAPINSDASAIDGPAHGPISYENWRAYLDGEQRYSCSEVPIYSDVDFSVPPTDGLGPYVFQHAFPADLRDPAFILVVNGHLDPSDLPKMDKTDTDGFTGTLLGDELAALLSLALGRRFMAGNSTRFLSDANKNEWVIMGDRARPTFFVPKEYRLIGKPSPVVPRALQPATHSAQILATLPVLSATEATSLVRAARAYRDGLWIAETEPELTWLLFVSALEVAAVQQHVEIPLIDILRLSKPKLVERLEAIDPALAEELAAELSRELRATARFLGFMERFHPPPPELRPLETWAWVDWSPKAMRKAMERIYKLRSLALHEGMPFPPPMCAPPMLLRTDWPAPYEGVLGISVASTGGVWQGKELPMSLHTFEYVVRRALLNWWEALADRKANVSAPTP